MIMHESGVNLGLPPVPPRAEQPDARTSVWVVLIGRGRQRPPSAPLETRAAGSRTSGPPLLEPAAAGREKQGTHPLGGQ
jgi:hypothetical protein